MVKRTADKQAYARVVNKNCLLEIREHLDKKIETHKKELKEIKESFGGHRCSRCAREQDDEIMPIEKRIETLTLVRDWINEKYFKEKKQ